MTRSDFRIWAAKATAIFRGEQHTGRMVRDWAEEVRPYDPELAELYVKSAEAIERIADHLKRKSQ